MSSILERFLPPIDYVPENPERFVNLEGKPMCLNLSNYDPSLVIHLNTYRPLWAIGGMKSLVAQNTGFERGSEDFKKHPVSFTVSLWCGGLQQSGSRVGMMNFRIVSTIYAAAEEIKGVCSLEKALLALVKLHVNRPKADRQTIKRPLDAIDRLDQAKEDVMKNCLTQPNGLTRADVAEMIVEVRGVVESMKKKP